MFRGDEERVRQDEREEKKKRSARFRRFHTAAEKGSPKPRDFRGFDGGAYAAASSVGTESACASAESSVVSAVLSAPCAMTGWQNRMPI